MQDKIISWIKDKVRVTGSRGIVLGISGGIDSAVVAALCKMAVGRGKVLGLIMPCHSHAQDASDARVFAQKLGIKTKTVDLSPAYDALTAALPAGTHLARGNIKPRLRMIALYYFANNLNYLVCGTGNKSELSVGYFTKYGDGGVDILPIGDLLKKEVVVLARRLGIPEAIISKPPSAGLWSGQTDEGEMGITYAELDDFIERSQKKKKQSLGGSKSAKIKKMIMLSGHKRTLPLICPRRFVSFT